MSKKNKEERKASRQLEAEAKAAANQQVEAKAALLRKPTETERFYFKDFSFEDQAWVCFRGTVFDGKLYSKQGVYIDDMRILTITGIKDEMDADRKRILQKLSFKEREQGIVVNIDRYKEFVNNAGYTDQTLGIQIIVQIIYKNNIAVDALMRGIKVKTNE